MNESKAKRICLEGSKKGNKICQAMQFFFGWDKIRIINQSCEMFEETIKEDKVVEQKDIHISYYFVASFYHFGSAEFEKNINKAIEYYNIAKNFNNSMAMYSLAIIYQNGNGDVKKDIHKAIDLYNRAIQLGNSMAMFNLALVYQFGRPGIEKNIDIAKELYQKCANYGNEVAKRKLEQIK